MHLESFGRFCELARRHAGISLGPAKLALVSARVAKRQRALGIPDAEGYLEYLESDETGRELVSFLDVISTNVTAFMREPAHFVELAAQAREWSRQGRRRLRLWSAACSTGEEPYSMAMTVLAAMGSKVDLKILATDISPTVLEHARRGVYSAAKTEAIDSELRDHFLSPCGESGQGPAYAVCDALRDCVVFRRLNLASPPFPMRGPFDAVFCRNVMIYFDAGVRRALVGEIGRLLGESALFMVGHSESLAGMNDGLALVRPSVFRRQRERAA